MYSALSCRRRGAKDWEREVIKQRNLSLEAHRASCTYTEKHTCRHVRAHKHSGPYALDVVRPVVCLRHVRVLACSPPPGDKKRSLLCVDNYSSHPYLAPAGLFRGAGKQNHTHTHTHTHTHSPVSFALTVFSPALPPLIACIVLTWLYSLVHIQRFVCEAAETFLSYELDWSNPMLIPSYRSQWHWCTVSTCSTNVLTLFFNYCNLQLLFWQFLEIKIIMTTIGSLVVTA